MTDRQKERTRQLIFRAFYQLLSEQPFQRISIDALAQQANIGRSTFYSHFSSKDDLLAAACNQLFEHVFHADEHAAHGISLHSGSQAQIAHLLRHFQENTDKVLTLYQLDDDYFLHYLREELRHCLPRSLQADHHIKTDLPESLTVSFIIESFLTVLDWWMTTGCQETAETVASYYLGLVKPRLLADDKS